MIETLPPIPANFALGVCDYPEHVPWEQWKHYPERQKQLGITYVRVAEFAWSKMEPHRRRVRLAMAGRCHRSARPGRTQSRHVHANRHSACLADSPASGNPAQPASTVIFATSVHASTTTTPARFTASIRAASPGKSRNAMGSIPRSKAGKPITNGAATAPPVPMAGPAQSRFANGSNGNTAPWTR